MKLGRVSLSPKTKAVLAAALALLLWVPQGISTDSQTVVTGHSTFFNGDSYDPCLASVAGIMRTRVMWFNDQVLVERYPGKGTFIYITEHGGQSPLETGGLYSDGVSYNFVDPNGAAWHVDELYIGKGGSLKTDYEEPLNWEYNTTHGDARAPYVDVGIAQAKQYVWVVEMSAQPIYDQFPGGDGHTYYNFLDLVDTCKFHNNTDTYRGYEYHNTSLGPSNGHPSGATPHAHQTWDADIYVGPAPTIVPAGASTDGLNYETSWAMNGGAQYSAQNAPNNAPNTAASAADPSYNAGG